MIFDYAFRQVYLLTTQGGQVALVTSGSTELLTAGQVGVFLAPNNIEGNAIAAGTATNCKVVSGSWHTKDSIAQFYGGLQMPQMSQLINWKAVTRFMKATAQQPQQQIVSFGWNQSSGSTSGPLFSCGTPYYLMLDFLGNPVLRLLNHQGYVTLPAFGACCTTDCSSGCTSSAVDAASIMLQWKDFMTSTQMPYLQSFMAPAVYIQSSGGTPIQVYSAQDTAAGRGNGTYIPNIANPASVVASFQITGAYIETDFGTCTFTPSDYFNLQPVQILGSLLTQDYTPCSVNTTINTSVPNMYTVLQQPIQARGIGQQVRRDYILSNRYLQQQFPDSIYTDSIRMRDIENDISGAVNVNAFYDIVLLEFNVLQGRHSNPTGLSDNDQYVLELVVPTGTSTTALTTLIAGCLTAVGSNVTLEQI